MIFLSVLGAFYFDNLREERAQEKLYVRHLKDFKEDLKENQGKFNYELRDNYVKASGEGYIKGSMIKYNGMYEIMTVPNRANADSMLSLINSREIFGVTRWIYESPQYERLDKDFYSFIKNDSLKSMLQMHRRNDESRVNVKNAINNYVRDFENIVDRLDLRAGATAANRQILFDNVSVNTIRRLGEYYQILRDMTRVARAGDSVLLLAVDAELALWNEND